MSQRVALYVFVGFILWLFVRDRKWRKGISSALWIPLLWVAILGSKPVSLWLGGGTQLETPDDYLKGSPLDMLIFLFLIVAGILVLWRRRVNWQSFISNNSWLFAFYLYWALSTTWSDYPFVSLKRWIKDVGNIV